MDVERIQKINNLAVELMKQGLVPDREAAVVEAEKIFRSQDTDDYSSMRDTISKVEEHKRREFSGDEKPMAADEIRDILQQNTNYLVKKLKEFQQKVESLEKDLAFLKSEVRLKQPSFTSAPPAASQFSSAPQIPRGSPVQPSAPVGNHPRSGNYKEDDVSIEKFFYMGAK